ncbi:MAG: DMT family transporter [Candidatus Heimdallarchaeota archaeon]|nr:DMT family transporter [Candidatus Heimdallarchaeota archaeon]
MIIKEELNDEDQESKSINSIPLTTKIVQPRLADERFTWQVLVMLLIIIFAWATPNVIGRYLYNTSTFLPIQISALRYVPAALTLGVFCLASKRGRQLILDLKEKWYHLLIASIILTSFVLLQMYSVTLTKASVSSFLLNVNPVITFILSFIFLKERHKWWGSFGVLIAACGIFFIAIPINDITSLFTGSFDVVLGNILAFLSGFMWAVYSIYLKKFLKDRDPITVTTWNLSFSALILLIAMFIFEGWFIEPIYYYHFITTTFMGIVPTAIAFTLWFETIRRISVQKASVFQFLIPVIATLFAMAMGEFPDWLFGLGGGLILIGLVITQFS